MKSVCVFCGSSMGARPEYRRAAHNMGRLMAERGVRVVYGGGRVGLMGQVADAALAAGGEVIGVIPQALEEREVAYTGLTELRVVASMHERKALMAELSDAFVALPGGIGTMEEFFETYTWAQLGLHRKPFGLLDVAGYYGPLARFLDHMVAEGFVGEAHRALVRVETDPERLLRGLAEHHPPPVRQWIDRSET